MKIDRLELIKILKEVKPALSNKESLNQSASFIFKNNKISTYNYEMSISCPIKNLNITATINAKEIYELLIKIKEKYINIKKKKHELIISLNKLKVGIKLQSEIKFPIKEIEKLNKWKNLPKNFIDGLNFCILSCDKNISSSVLSYINLNKNGSIESSNGFTIASYKLSKNIFKKSILLSGTVIFELVKYKINKVLIEKNWIHFKTKNNTIISCKISNEHFPDIQNIIEFKGKKLKLSKNLIEIIDKAKIFSSSELSNESYINLTVNNNKIIITSTTETGWFKESLKFKNKNKINFSFKINPEHLIMALTSINNGTCVYYKNKIKFVNENITLVIPIAINKKEKYGN